jgi:hypothetical protein
MDPRERIRQRLLAYMAQHSLDERGIMTRINQAETDILMTEVEVRAFLQAGRITQAQLYGIRDFLEDRKPAKEGVPDDYDGPVYNDQQRHDIRIALSLYLDANPSVSIRDLAAEISAVNPDRPQIVSRSLARFIRRRSYKEAEAEEPILKSSNQLVHYCDVFCTRLAPQDPVNALGDGLAAFFQGELLNAAVLGMPAELLFDASAQFIGKRPAGKVTRLSVSRMWLGGKQYSRAQEAVPAGTGTMLYTGVVVPFANRVLIVMKDRLTGSPRSYTLGRDLSGILVAWDPITNTPYQLEVRHVRAE